MKKRILAALGVAALSLLACAPSYSHLEEVGDNEYNARRFDGSQPLQVGVGWSARLRALDTSDEPHRFDIRATDETRLVVAPVSTTNDTDYEAEGGVRFAFLPRKVGRADIEVIVDGAVAERITLTVSAQR
jgi:hypothetical protein